MKIIALAATNSAQSINKQLVTYAASLFTKQSTDADVEILDINDYEMPIYSPERESQLGQPEQAVNFYNKLGSADVIVISYAEHNGSYTAAYKNLFDWTSRVDMKVYQDKKMLLLSTSPGPGGAATVLNSAVTSAPYFAGDVKASVSVPSFFDNFNVETGELTNAVLNDNLLSAVAAISAS